VCYEFSMTVCHHAFFVAMLGYVVAMLGLRLMANSGPWKLLVEEYQNKN
jgi:hypothetical protein